MFREDPGPCPICDAPHCSCTPGGGDTIVLLSQRDAMATLGEAQPVNPPADLVPPEPEIERQPVPFKTSEYKRAVHGPKRPRRGAA